MFVVHLIYSFSIKSNDTQVLHIDREFGGELVVVEKFAAYPSKRSLRYESVYDMEQNLAYTAQSQRTKN